MKLPISSRLLACCEYVHPGDRIADVGCDHGYLGIHLLQQNIASSVIASDINRGPLEAAMRNAAKYGFAEKMSFFLSDGAQDIPRDFDTLICAGMGADTMVSILEGAPWLADSQYRLILQCQSKTPMLRKYLSEKGWCINKEIVLKDGRFLYTVMEVVYAPSSKLTPGECYLPPALFVRPTEYLQDYCTRVVKELEKIVSAQKENADPFQVTALQELKNGGILWPP